MLDPQDIQRMIADAWAAGYAAREAELVCRRRSSPAHREAEIARLTERVLKTNLKASSSFFEAPEMALAN